MRDLPSGTVTLLFTDIEGSTRMLQELGREAYVRALTEHRRLLREAFTSHDGVEVEMQGDSFHFAFPYARNAVAAALAGQRALQEHTWEHQAIKVRIGLHTGEPMQADGLYAGLDVHQAARIMSAAHGGQILLSARTAELVAGELREVTLRDLGEHGLKDLSAPQRLFQAGEGEFPLPNTLGSNNLPVQATTLVGRATELTDLDELLTREDVRLVTLTGTGGTGKTRLALQVAAELTGKVVGGVVWVALAPIPRHELVLAAIARAVGVREEANEPLAETLAASLEPRRLLLLLDNFEHVLDARAVLAELLARCPDLKALVTSRAALGLSIEHLYEVPTLREDEAIELFRQRAAQIGAEVAADETAAAICRRLDRLPLAIELAAARARVLEPATMLARLERRLPLLRSGALDRPARQQTLEATIAWSHDLLDEAERTLFRRLSVFAGTFTLESAEQVAEADVWTLDALVAKSLVRRWGSGRFGLLETIREFAAEQLGASGEVDATEEAHALHYLELALGLEPNLPAGPMRAESTKRLAAEVDNLRAALDYFSRLGRSADELRLATAVWRFWMAHGYFGSGRRWLERPLRAVTEVPDTLRAAALEGVAVLSMLEGAVNSAEGLVLESIELFRQLGDLRGVAESLNNLGVIAWSRGDRDRALTLIEEAAAVARAAALPSLVAMTSGNRGGLAQELGDSDRAFEFMLESVRLYEELGDRGRAVIGSATLGEILIGRGRCDEAIQQFVRVLDAADEVPQRDLVSNALFGIGLALAQTLDPERGARMVGAGDALLYAIGGNFNDADMRERAVTVARERLGEDAFESAYAAGRNLPFGEALSEARQAASPPAPGSESLVTVD